MKSEGCSEHSRVARMQPASMPADYAMSCLRAESGVVAHLFPGFRLRSIRATVLGRGYGRLSLAPLIHFDSFGIDPYL